MKVRNFVHKLGLLCILLISLSVLAACGSTPAPEQVNNDFTVPTPTSDVQEYATLENDSTFKSKVLQNDPSLPPSNLKIYATTQSLDAIKSFYTGQMPGKGWNDRSSAIIDPTALGTDAWVLGYEKNTSGNPPTTHVVGLYMFNQNSVALKDFKSQLPPNNQNVLMVITGTNK